MTTTTPTPPERAEPDEQELARKKRRQRIATNVVGGVILGVLALCGVGIAMSNSDPEPSDLRVSGASFASSPGGRVEVAFTVANEGDQIATPSCDVRAEDADGYRVGQDKLTGLVIEPGTREHYRTVTGISAASVARVTISC